MKQMLEEAQADGEIDASENMALLKKQWEVETQQKLAEKEKRIEQLESELAATEAK